MYYKVSFVVLLNYLLILEHIPYIPDKFDRIQFLIKKSDKKASEVADFIGISREHLHKYIKEKKLSDEKIKMILNVINVSFDDFNKAPNFKNTNNILQEPETAYNIAKPPNNEDFFNLRIADLEARLKDKDEIISNKNEIIEHLKEKNKRAETLEKVFVSALSQKTTLKEFHNLIESAVVE